MTGFKAGQLGPPERPKGHACMKTLAVYMNSFGQAKHHSQSQDGDASGAILPQDVGGGASSSSPTEFPRSSLLGSNLFFVQARLHRFSRALDILIYFRQMAGEVEERACGPGRRRLTLAPPAWDGLSGSRFSCLGGSRRSCRRRSWKWITSRFVRR